MPKPTILDIHEATKGMSVEYELKGEKIRLCMQADRLKSCINLKSHMGTPPKVQQIGSKVFQEPMPKTVWLLLDMVHLILLLAKRTKADRKVLKLWFEEAKNFLKGMEKEV